MGGFFFLASYMIGMDLFGLGSLFYLPLLACMEKTLSEANLGPYGCTGSWFKTEMFLQETGKTCLQHQDTRCQGENDPRRLA